jgi:hypothetical protein
MAFIGISTLKKGFLGIRQQLNVKFKGFRCINCRHAFHFSSTSGTGIVDTKLLYLTRYSK